MTWDYRPFDGIELAYPAIAATFLLFGAAVNFSVIVGFLVHRKLLESSTNKLMFNLAIADCLVGTIAGSLNLISAIRHAWDFDHRVCEFFGWFVLVCGGQSFQLLSMTAVDRYMTVVKGRPIPSHVLRRIIIACWVAIMLFACMGLEFSFGELVLGPAAIGCVGNWGVRWGGFAYSTLGFIWIDSFVLMLAFCYYKIFMKVRQTTAQAAHLRASRFQAVSERKERQLLVKLVTISASFLTCWIFYSGMMAYQTVTGKEPSAAVDFFATVLTYFCAMLNPFLYSRISLKRDKRVSSPQVTKSWTSSKKSSKSSANGTQLASPSLKPTLQHDSVSGLTLTQGELVADQV